MYVQAAALKRRLAERITEQAHYKSKVSQPLTLNAILHRAAALAAQVVDEVIAEQTAQRDICPRTVEAAAARARLMNVLAEGPLTAAEAGLRAGLTVGKCAHYLRHTPGIVQLDDKRWSLAPAPEGR